jgi:transcriptional regulator with XRE-family HTH domain
MAQNSKAAQGFADRLVAAMRAKGMTSNRSRSGVDVAALAKAAGVSYEMARRYVEGKANPKPDVVSVMAQWLGMSTASLLYGESGASADVNLDALERCMLAVTDAQQSAGLSLSPEEAARVVAQLYAEAVKGHGPSVSTLTALIRAIGKRL